MNESSWHIPRASLAGSSASASSNSSNKSHSNPSTVTRHSRNHYLNQEGHSNLAYVIDENERMGEKGRQKRNERRSRGRGGGKRDRSVDNNNLIHSQHHSASSGKLSRSHRNHHDYDDENNTEIKRGSRSSQGSTDSNSSTHSASSGSLLLTAANLERFAAIHKTQHKLENLSEYRQNYTSNIQQQNLNKHPQQQQLPPKNVIKTNNHNIDDISRLSNNNNDAVIEIDPNLHFVKTKDVDTVSIASSTHFTMVNGIGGPPRKVKEGLCSRGHQVTVLIVSMSFFFLIGISTMVYLLEMRAREMPQM